MSRKDSKGLFANVLGQIDQTPAPAPVAKTSSPHLLKVAAGVRQIQERGEVLDKILKDGEHIIELDPDAIAPSAIADRLDGAYESSAIEEMVVSMRERGQIVPGLVRPVPGQPSTYQIVFGRRRLAAAKALGIKFRAIVRQLTDEQAVIFQGEENTNRNDLSFIEKCAFALSLEQAGYRRDVISASLSTGKSHISEMLSIATAIPREALVMIGPARDIGRRRWVEFVERWNNAANPQDSVSAVLDRAGYGPDADRFTAALKSLTQPKSSSADEQDKTFEVTAKGLVIATVKTSKAGARMTFSKAVQPGFVEFMSKRIEDLHDQYMKELWTKKES
ncbi:plasmid partitioning protein RepB [Rhizobium sp. XQZ8]|uniref:plasmid partitioning protein RepB n=1 Tax=Rhizobium populisoli TaxID=2859785 RepID=UPI001CA4A8C6|nr:plasmid partitioning protein RepB [Rhizobium populisoli]MBW6422158.1 plasmid partitioning protein RepB [Rhizobium populisoli]